MDGSTFAEGRRRKKEDVMMVRRDVDGGRMDWECGVRLSMYSHMIYIGRTVVTKIIGRLRKRST